MAATDTETPTTQELSYSDEELSIIKNLLSPLTPPDYSEDEMFAEDDSAPNIEEEDALEDEEFDEDEDNDFEEDDNHEAPPGLDFGDDEEAADDRSDNLDDLLGDLGEPEELQDDEISDNLNLNEEQRDMPDRQEPEDLSDNENLDSTEELTPGAEDFDLSDDSLELPSDINSTPSTSDSFDPSNESDDAIDDLENLLDADQEGDTVIDDLDNLIDTDETADALSDDTPTSDESPDDLENLLQSDNETTLSDELPDLGEIDTDEDSLSELDDSTATDLDDLGGEDLSLPATEEPGLSDDAANALLQGGLNSESMDTFAPDDESGLSNLDELDLAADQNLSQDLQADSSLEISDADLPELDSPQDLSSDTEIPDTGVFDDINTDNVIESTSLDDLDSGDEDLVDLSDQTASADNRPADDLSAEGLPPLDDFDLMPQGELEDDDTSDLNVMGMDAVMEEMSDDDQGKEDRASKIKLSDDELDKIKEILKSYSFAVRQSARRVILDELLPENDIQSLIGLLLHEADEKQVKKFLEKKLKIKIDSLTADSSRKVIGSKKDYSLEGLRRKQRVVRITKILGALFIVGVFLGMLGYRFIYKPWQAQSYFEKGMALILKPGNEAVDKPSDYNNAEGFFNKGLEYSPEDIEAYNDFALAYLERKKFDKAKKKLDNAAQINLKNRNYDPETWYNLGLYHIESRRPRKLPSDGKRLSWSEAARDYFRKANRHGDNLKAVEGIGRTYLLEKDYKKAEAYFKKVVSQDPENIIGHASLLNLYIDLDKLTDTMIVHRTIRDLKLEDQLNPYLRAKLGSYYLDQRDVRIKYNIQSDEKDQQDTLRPIAQDVLFALAKDYPDFAEGRYQLARYYRDLKSYRKAFRQLEDTVRLDEKHFRAHTLMAEMLLERGEINSAYGHLKKAVDAYKSRSTSNLQNPYYPKENIGRTYSVLGDLFYSYPQNISRRPDIDEVMGNNIDRNENLNLAIKYYREAEKAGYENPQQNFNLGRALYMEGNYEGSLDQWMRLHTKLYSNPHLLFALANVFYKLNKIEASQGEIKKLIDDYEYRANTISKPNLSNAYHTSVFRLLASAYNNLGAIYEKKDNEREAIISYWKAIEHSRYVDKENVYARLNLNRMIRTQKRLAEPILDENIPKYLYPQSNN